MKFVYILSNKHKIGACRVMGIIKFVCMSLHHVHRNFMLITRQVQSLCLLQDMCTNITMLIEQCV